MEGLIFGNLTIRELKQQRAATFLRNARQPKVSFFSLLICLDATKFVLLGVFTLIETICYKICLRPKIAKSPLPVDLRYRVFSHDVAAAILVSQNSEMAAMLVSQTNPWELNSFLMQTLSCVP